jgi:hypothetical protein
MLDKYKQLNKALNDFGKYVVQQSRTNLTKDGVSKGALYDSISYDLIVEKDAFLLEFLMEDYGIFQDKGVKGANPSLVKGGKQKAPSSQFSYRSKMPPMEPLRNWAQSKNLRFRDKEGKFKKGSYKSMAFVLQRSIFAQGLKPTMFFTKPFEQAFKRFPDHILEQFAIDVENQLTYGEK